MNWIKQPTILENDIIQLLPLCSSHFDELVSIGSDSRIWEFMSINGTDNETLLTHLRSALLKRTTEEQYPFTVYHKHDKRIIGSTFYHNIFPQHRKLEIGWTWYHPDYWKTSVNRNCKLLLLTNAFEELKAIRVQLITDKNNARSRAAIEGIGAVLEGIHRNERIRANGMYRDSVMYSIIDSEWPEVKAQLERKLAKY